MTKPSDEASSWSSQIFGRQAKLVANSHHLKDYPADYRAFISREITNEERIIERNLLKKRRDLIESGTKRTSIRIRNLKLYVDGNRNIYDNQHTASSY